MSFCVYNSTRSMTTKFYSPKRTACPFVIHKEKRATTSSIIDADAVRELAALLDVADALDPVELALWSL